MTVESATVKRSCTFSCCDGAIKDSSGNINLLFITCALSVQRQSNVCTQEHSPQPSMHIMDGLVILIMSILNREGKHSAFSIREQIKTVGGYIKTRPTELNAEIPHCLYSIPKSESSFYCSTIHPHPSLLDMAENCIPLRRV